MEKRLNPDVSGHPGKFCLGKNGGNAGLVRVVRDVWAYFYKLLTFFSGSFFRRLNGWVSLCIFISTQTTQTTQTTPEKTRIVARLGSTFQPRQHRHLFDWLGVARLNPTPARVLAPGAV